jgi:hypothetical protein
MDTQRSTILANANTDDRLRRGGVRLTTHAKASRILQRLVKGDEPQAILGKVDVESKRQVDSCCDVDHK